MRRHFKILFYLKRNKIKADGTVPIMVRVTVNGEIKQFSAKVDVIPSLWDNNSNRVKGQNAYATHINSILNSIDNTLRKHHNLFSVQQILITPEMLVNAYNGIMPFDDHIKEEPKHYFLQYFREYLEQREKLVVKKKIRSGHDNGIARSTFAKEKNAYNRLEEYLQIKLLSEPELTEFQKIKQAEEAGEAIDFTPRFFKQVRDVEFDQIDIETIMAFETFLRTEKKNCNNAAKKLIQIFKRVYLIGHAAGKATKNPFFTYKMNLDEVDRGYLEMHEIEKIMQTKFDIPRLEQIRDVFIFSIFTGLAHIDMFTLRKEHIKEYQASAELWVMKNRVKTGNISNIPMFTIPIMILEKYAEQCENEDDPVLPVISNQKTNAYLKELAVLCGIDKHLTFHLARHTFATSITLENGVPLETVSKMLGHRSIKTTEKYARMTKKRISNDMGRLSKKLSKFQQSYTA